MSETIEPCVVGTLTLYPEEQSLIGPRGGLRLTSAHFRVLHRLMRRPGVIVSTSDLISAMYPDPDDEGENGYGCLRQVILTLRRAILLLGGGPENGSVVIAAETGIGYVIRKNERAR